MGWYMNDITDVTYVTKPNILLTPYQNQVGFLLPNPTATLITLHNSLCAILCTMYVLHFCLPSNVCYVLLPTGLQSLFPGQNSHESGR